MKVSTFTVLLWLALASAAAAQGSSSKTQLSEVRSLVHELQGRTEKLRDLNTQYRSLVEQRPQPEGGSPEAKQAHEAQLAKWSAALERLLRRLDEARASVVESMQRLDQAAAGKLPTALAKDVANAHNDADSQRAAAEEALAKNKSAPARGKRAEKPAASEKPAPPPSDALDDL